MAIYKRPSTSGRGSHWQVVVEERDPEGRRKRRVVGTYARKADAERAERQAIEDRDAGTLVKKSKQTVAQLMQHWLEVEMPRTVRPENRQAYEIAVNKHIVPALGAKQVQQLTVEDVERFYASLDVYSSSTKRKVHMRLSSALKMAKRWSLVRENVCELVSPPKAEQSTKDVWSVPEANAFLAKAKDDGMFPYWLLAMESGARTSELLGLTWADFDAKRQTITLGTRVVRLLKGTPTLKDDAKTLAGRRTIRLTPTTVKTLEDFHAGAWAEKGTAAGDDWQNDLGIMFCTASGRLINPAHVRRSFDRLVKAAGVKRITPHGMRRTHITHTVAAGANIKAVAARVGHADVTTTIATYTRLVPQMDDDLMKLIVALQGDGAMPEPPVPQESTD